MIDPKRGAEVAPRHQRGQATGSTGDPRSQRGRKIPDLLIAAAAEELGFVVLHYDADFDLIASITGQPCRWAVPAGSVQ